MSSPFAWSRRLSSSYKRRRRELETVEPEYCNTVTLSPVGLHTEVCKTPDSISKKYGCSEWVPITLLTPVMGLGHIDSGSNYVMNLRMVNMKRGERTYTFVCYEDMLIQTIALLSQTKSVDDLEIVDVLRAIDGIASIYVFKALRDLRASDLIGLETERIAAQRIEEIRKQKQLQPNQQKQIQM